MWSAPRRHCDRAGVLNRATESDESAIDLLARISSLLVVWGAVPADMLNATPALVASAALQSAAFPARCLISGRGPAAASVIRERFSPDAWRALTDLVELINAPLDQGLTESALIERVNGALRIIASFSGLRRKT